MRARVWHLLLLAAPAACTSLLGIDGEYAVSGELTSSGGQAGGASGGAPGGAGGRGAGGAAGTTGGSGTGGSVGGQTSCGAGEKLCPIDSVPACVTPDPSVGCGPTGCDPCTWPVDGRATCAGDQCDFDCSPGFTKNSAAGTCDPTGGTGGTSGGNGCTQDSDCIPGSPCTGFPPCCSPLTQSCGCKYVAWCQ